MEQPDFVIGILRAELYFRGCRTLKDRRGFLLSIRDRIRNMGLSFAQIGPADLVKHTWLAVSCVSGSHGEAEKMLDRAAEILIHPEWEIVDIEKNFIHSE